MYVMTPSDQKSTPLSYGIPSRISGEKYIGVPQAVVMSCSVDIFAKPKSAILSTASSSLVVQRMF